MTSRSPQIESTDIQLSVYGCQKMNASTPGSEFDEDDFKVHLKDDDPDITSECCSVRTDYSTLPAGSSAATLQECPDPQRLENLMSQHASNKPNVFPFISTLLRFKQPLAHQVEHTRFPQGNKFQWKGGQDCPSDTYSQRTESSDYVSILIDGNRRFGRIMKKGQQQTSGPFVKISEEKCLLKDEDGSSSTGSTASSSDSTASMGDGRSYYLWIVGAVGSICVLSVLISAVSFYGVFLTKETESEFLIHLPCNDLARVHSLATLHRYHDEVTNQSFKDAAIRRFKQAGNVETFCELPFVALLKCLADKKRRPTVGHFLLDLDETGSAQEQPRYPMSIIQTVNITNVKADGKSVTVQSNGQYFIFFGTRYVYNNNLCNKLQYKTSGANVLRGNSGDQNRDDVLVGTYHTCCETCKEETRTKFIGGVFHLTKNDVLTVKVSAPETISRTEGNFLGIMELS